MKIALGLDFGTESVRALLVDLRGRELHSATARYRHGQLTDSLPHSRDPLPPHYALQHPEDWLDSAAQAVRAALRGARADRNRVVGIGVDFTSCTMLPCLEDGTPLCLMDRWKNQPHAWPKLWKHHGAQKATDRINEVARQRGESFLNRYGGVVGLEWLFPKMLETLQDAPRVFDAAEVWLEAGDWLVWQLTRKLTRSTCQAGYKGLWSPGQGWPSEAMLRSVHPQFARVLKALPGSFLPPGQAAGTLTRTMAKRLNLSEGTPVSAAIIDAHAGVPGAGAAEPGTLVMVLGTSSCHMLNAKEERQIPGVAGVVKDGILPGFYGYETGQAAVGDTFDWVRRLTGQSDFQALSEAAGALAPGAGGVRCLDWFNGCRTPLMDGSLKGLFSGLALHHRPAHLYRAALEASAFGLRWIVDLLRAGGLPVKKFVATGGLPHHNRLLMQIYADVLGERITIHPSRQGPALGAAILGALAAGAFASPHAAIRAMAQRKDAPVIMPDRRRHRMYTPIYSDYRNLAAPFSSSAKFRNSD